MSVATMPDTPTTDDRFAETFAAVASDVAGRESDRMAELRAAAHGRFAELGYPTKKMEEWRFTDIKPLADTTFRAPTVHTVERSTIERYLYEDCTQLVLVNGRYSPELSSIGNLPEGVVVSDLASAWGSHADLLNEHLGVRAKFDEHAFVALNTAMHQDGVFIHVPKNTVVEKPINLVLVGTPEEEPVAFFPRLLFVAEESAQVTLFEQHVTALENEASVNGGGTGVYFTCPVLEIVAHPNSNIDHYKLQRESKDAFHMSTLQLWQDRDSDVSSHCLSWGGAIVRNDVNAILDGEGIESTLNGLYMVEGTQVVDNHMRVEHAKPNCNSHELYKGILEGEARAVFTGRIYVHEDAQKTDAKQTNRNLILSDRALCHSQPQLEIFADDVKCTHGSTVGQLDETAIFYLRSRGIGEEAARSLLTYAFASDIVSRIKVAAVRHDLEEFLFRRLPRGEVVRQAV